MNRPPGPEGLVPCDGSISAAITRGPTLIELRERPVQIEFFMTNGRGLIFSTEWSETEVQGILVIAIKGRALLYSNPNGVSGSISATFTSPSGADNVPTQGEFTIDGCVIEYDRRYGIYSQP